jgi:hypothetical protein
MSLRFRYILFPTKGPVASLDGRFVRPRPTVLVSLIGPSGTTLELAQLDSGADDCVFPIEFAEEIGIDLSNAPVGEAAGVGQQPVGLRFAQVTMRIANGGERCEWRAWIAFTDMPMKRPLLGFAGFLQFFTATFRGDQEAVELEVNSLFPGTLL